MSVFFWVGRVVDQYDGMIHACEREEEGEGRGRMCLVECECGTDTRTDTAGQYNRTTDTQYKRGRVWA
jgi:hypothetical protein